MTEDGKCLAFVAGGVVLCVIFPPLGALLIAVAVISLIVSFITKK